MIWVLEPIVCFAKWYSLKRLLALPKHFSILVAISSKVSKEILFLKVFAFQLC